MELITHKRQKIQIPWEVKIETTIPQPKEEKMKIDQVQIEN